MYNLTYTFCLRGFFLGDAPASCGGTADKDTVLTAGTGIEGDDEDDKNSRLILDGDNIDG
jgi:hypothetical protein